MEQRQQLAILAKTGEFTITELSRRFGVSRKTVHKWIDRFEHDGLAGLADRHRGPKNSPQKTADEVEAIITAEVRTGDMGNSLTGDMGNSYGGEICPGELRPKWNKDNNLRSSRRPGSSLSRS